MIGETDRKINAIWHHAARIGTDADSFAVMAAVRCKHVLGFDEDFTAGGFKIWHGH